MAYCIFVQRTETAARKRKTSTSKEVKVPKLNTKAGHARRAGYTEEQNTLLKKYFPEDQTSQKTKTKDIRKVLEANPDLKDAVKDYSIEQIRSKVRCLYPGKKEN